VCTVNITYLKTKEFVLNVETLLQYTHDMFAIRKERPGPNFICFEFLA
jgi:hypothetical protein